METAARHLHLLGATGVPRTEKLDGKDYLVIPVVALMEGVIHAVNAPSPEFVPVTTLHKAYTSWEGKPVTVGHPRKDGKMVSAAEDKKVQQEYGIGFIKNVRIEGKKMLLDAWVQPSRAKALNASMLARLMAGKVDEVSVGAYVVVDGIASKDPVTGRTFSASWIEISGDHLAFLPGGRGACSVEMGCGTHRAAMRVCAEEFKFLAADDTPEEAASEEAAELVAYRSMRALMDVVGDQWDKASAIINDLIADEIDDPTETPEEEDAEEEMESARIDALRIFCSSMSGSLQSIISATYGSAMIEDYVAGRYMAAKKKMTDCPMCDGNGTYKGNPCPTCGGDGEVPMTYASAVRHEGGQWVVCSFDGLRRLGAHKTKEDALAQYRAIVQSLARQKAS